MENYLNTLAKDFARKIKSVEKYIELIKNETGEINQITYTWLGRLKKKYEILDKFEKTRQHPVSATEFSVEQPSNPKIDGDKAQENIKDITGEINDLSGQLNHIFKRLAKETSFLLQTEQEIQDLINSIYDNFENLYDRM